VTTAFPGAIDNFTNPIAADPLDSATVPHASQHANINDAVEAIETAIGTTAVPVLARLAGYRSSRDAWLIYEKNTIGSKGGSGGGSGKSSINTILLFGFVWSYPPSP